MTLSPDFAAARYTIDNKVDISIGRIPYHFELLKNHKSNLQLEASLAYQHTKETIQLFSTANENIDADWYTYGADIGLLYESNLNQHLSFTPSLRLGMVRMKNNAKYNGVLTNVIKDGLEGTFFNWKTNAHIFNIGLGLNYNWKLLDRSSVLSANVHHILVNSFSESNEAVSFKETASMLTLKGEIIFPTALTIQDHRLDVVLLLGSNHFFGENRNTLGYTTSYQTGLGAEFPITINQKNYGYLRASGQMLWANNMDGWIISLGYNSEH